MNLTVIRSTSRVHFSNLHLRQKTKGDILQFYGDYLFQAFPTTPMANLKFTPFLDIQ